MSRDQEPPVIIERPSSEEPDGYFLVPTEPTQETVLAGEDASWEAESDRPRVPVQDVWAAMLKAWRKERGT
jgi:hypothetical protein